MTTKTLICEEDAVTGEQAVSPDPDPLCNRAGSTPAACNIFWNAGRVSQQDRQQQLGHRPATVWLTGLSGAGKSTLAYELELMLLTEKHPCYVLDGDNLRHHLNRDLGFSTEDRKENIRRAAEVARLMNEAGLVVITSFISPRREDREMARAIIGEERFIEVHVSTSARVCESRDPKGLYAKARAGQIPDFTGISSPYEPPTSPALEIDMGRTTPDEAARTLRNCLANHLGRS
ncbi:MAG TPA: adenylyl-sulfate kinase [Noviherbaspirillum sp.]|jgi:adenylyl-sulfate kinase|uniref:adenylyl-sulfate kinase n=1 Tax=Noviherbaspirillum sp. TaxID=1926288 RepID=UPI002DDDA19C|nr:adenylyl-sulfate kinase [Noviherbaspirillum sp.]HEV2610000.1 adenylyl-sulfate kinase [Noviherbaspirillum sp.]